VGEALGVGAGDLHECERWNFCLGANILAHTYTQDGQLSWHGSSLVEGGCCWKFRSCRVHLNVQHPYFTSRLLLLISAYCVALGSLFAC
jgi:hypothetical protein